MHTTLTLTLDQYLADFIQQQPGTLDPSAFINTLILEDMRHIHMQHNKTQVQPNTAKQNPMRDREALEVSIEKLIDEQIPAAG